MKLPAAILAAALAFPAYADTSAPYSSVGPWEIAMPDIPQVSCIGTRIYGQTVLSLSIAPDREGIWSLWLAFYSRTYSNPGGEQIPALFRIGDGVSLSLVGTADGDGLIYFWTPATPVTLSALETSALLTVTTNTGNHLFPLDGISAAMSAIDECWDEKQVRENPAL